MTRRWHLAEGRVIGVRLPDSVYADVKRIARKRKMTVSSCARSLIENEVESVNATLVEARWRWLRRKLKSLDKESGKLATD